MLKTVFLSISLIVLFVCPAKADSVITSGSFTVSGFGAPFNYSFSFGGPGFNTSGAIRSIGGAIPLANCAPCPRGGSVSLGANSNLNTPSDFLFGHMFVNGVDYGFYPFEGTLPPTPPNLVQPFGYFNFVTSSITIPSVDDETLMIAALFSMEGYISSSGGTPFSVHFNGEGNATAILSRVGSGYVYQSITYTFTEPVPEPASLLLLCSALVGMHVRTRRKRI